MRALICTFGFDDAKIVEAIRSISHDELHIVTGVDNLEQDSYLRLVELCKALGRPVDVVTTDIFDLGKSFESVQTLMRRLKGEGKDVKLNISGGLPLLTDAALLAAFNEGVVTYYVDERTIQLPVLRNVTIGERLSREQKSVLRRLKAGTALSDLDKQPRKDLDMKRVLLELKRLDLIRVDDNGSGGVVELTAEGESVRSWLMRSDR